MTVRTTETTVTFEHPFTLKALGGPQPAGVYRIVIDEEEILGLSFLAFRRTATMLQLPALQTYGSTIEIIRIDRQELDAALEADSGR